MATTTELYDILTERLLGGVLFVTLLMITGFIGNLHVLLVYKFRMKSSNHRIFILFLGVLDFLASCIAMPFTVITLRQPETFTKTPTCKLYWFANYFLCTASGLALLAIAIERYRKICVPLGWQLTRRLAILTCFIVVLITTATSWPVLILMGTTTVPTDIPRITDSICATEDRENYMSYQIYYHIVLSLMVCPCFVALVVMYTLIWKVVRKYNALKQNRYKFIASEASTESDRKTEIILADSQEQSSRKSRKTNQNTESNNLDRQSSRKSRKSIKNTESSDRKKLDKAKKTTIAFILISVIFFISYIPYLILTVLIYSNSIINQTSSEVVFVNIIRYTPYINNVANVFIYGCFDVKFQREVQTFYKNMVCCKLFRELSLQ